jgi:RNA recognition motif-containing protein
MRRRAEGPSEPELVSREETVGNLPTVEEAMEALENRAANPRGASAIPCRLFVGGVSWNTTEEDLRQAFSQFGPVADAAIVKDRDTGQSRGFAFVTMADRKDAGRAIDGLNGSELDGRRLVVNVATARTR